LRNEGVQGVIQEIQDNSLMMFFFICCLA